MTEKTCITENGSYTETELCISEFVGSFLLNFKDTRDILCELHEVPIETLQDMYKTVRDSITVCLLASELPCSVLNILSALVSLISHEIVKRQIDGQ